MKKRTYLIYIFALCTFYLSISHLSAQNKAEFEGQLSAFGIYSPNSALEVLLGTRYIPQLNYDMGFAQAKNIHFEAAANLYGSTSFHPFDRWSSEGSIDPYRLWARYAGKRLEIRLGLQKIDFGVATLLRPLQWFNEIDPRDPLQQTNGVYGVLGRYYFLNNANIWLWTLYGNDKVRGFDALKTYNKHPEFGGRIQYPVPRGELAASYHHRTVDWQDTAKASTPQRIAEDRFALDGKWDIEIGLWFEASYVRKAKNLGPLTNQTFINLGTDYTFAVGNGLNVVMEHLITSYDTSPFRFRDNQHITASTASYPMGLSDNLSTILYYAWRSQEISYFFNYEHRFSKITGNAMIYYNGENGQSLKENEFVNAFSGFGIQFMIVYNH